MRTPSLIEIRQRLGVVCVEPDVEAEAFTPAPELPTWKCLAIDLKARPPVPPRPSISRVRQRSVKHLRPR
jgi:hypothetical protein